MRYDQFKKEDVYEVGHHPVATNVMIMIGWALFCQPQARYGFGLTLYGHCTDMTHFGLGSFALFFLWSMNILPFACYVRLYFLGSCPGSLSSC